MFCTNYAGEGGELVQNKRWIALLIGAMAAFTLLSHREPPPEAVSVFHPVEIVDLELKQHVADFTGLRKSLFTQVAADRFVARIDGGDFVVELCPVRGEVTRITNERPLRSAALTVEDGLKIAETFLVRNGYEGFPLQSYAAADYRVIADFGAVEVTVGLDNGRVKGFILHNCPTNGAE